MLECRTQVQRIAGTRLGISRGLHEGFTRARRCEGTQADNLQPAF